MREATVATERTLPDFENPPAVETLMGVHFAPIEKWQSPHFGLFWSRIKDDYPKAEMQPPVIQPPDVEGVFSRVQSPEKFPLRCWFYNPDETRLIQVQNNLFLHNWRRIARTERYLHYDDLRPHFEREWRTFRGFLEREGLGVLAVSACEVTYINHIDRGSGWDTFADLPQVFPNWNPTTSHHFLPSPELVAINALYPLKDVGGHLQITAQPAVRRQDAKETIQLTVTVRCKPASSSDESIYLGLDAARKWVVLGFTDFTSPTMHKIWGRKI
jgi:uncharacterized protein (TIGR04255 family)